MSDPSNSGLRPLLLRGVFTLLAIYVLYILCVGLFSSVSGQAWKGPDGALKDDRAKASCMAEGVVQPLEQELGSLFGWLPNDLFPVPQFIDNKTNYQRGVIYATRSASDVLSRTIARYGDRDTVPQLLVDATAKDFAYAENSWGWWVLYSSETRYKAGIKAWRTWASRVGDTASNRPEVYNMTTKDVVVVLNWAESMMDYALGMLNDDKLPHFQADDVVYYVKGVCRVVDSVLRSLITCDGSVVTRGGKENVDECLKRLSMISQFNPVYVTAGTSGVGDSFWPNHIASLARHADVVGNRLNDIRTAMEK